MKLETSFTFNGETFKATGYSNPPETYVSEIFSEDGEAISFLDCSIELIIAAQKSLAAWLVCLTHYVDNMKLYYGMKLKDLLGEILTVEKYWPDDEDANFTK